MLVRGYVGSLPGGPLTKIIFGLRGGQDSRRRIEEAAQAAAKGPIQFAEIGSTESSFGLRIRDLHMR
jgi:hypothetical protein